jgi:hypothetical protein
MKTRQEMIYDFMVALASNPNLMPDPRKFFSTKEEADEVFVLVHKAAAKLADEYLGNI